MSTPLGLDETVNIWASPSQRTQCFTPWTAPAPTGRFRPKLLKATVFFEVALACDIHSLNPGNIVYGTAAIIQYRVCIICSVAVIRSAAVLGHFEESTAQKFPLGGYSFWTSCWTDMWNFVCASLGLFVWEFLALFPLISLGFSCQVDHLGQGKYGIGSV